MASSPVNAPPAPSQDSDSSPPPPTPSDSPATPTNSTSSSPPPPASPTSPPPPALPTSPPPSPPTSPPPAPPTSPPPSPLPASPRPSSPPPASPPPSSPPPTSPPPPSSSSSSPPPEESSSSPPPPAQPQSPPPNTSPSPPPSDAPPVAASSPPPPSATPSPPSPPTASPIPPSSDGGAPPWPIFFPPPPVSESPPSPPSSSTTLSPPPPSQSHKRPDSPNASSGSGSSPSSHSSSSNAATIAGVTLGGLLILAFIFVCLVCTRRRKKKQAYYMDPARGPKGGEYYNGTANWHSPHPMDHVIKLPPPPGVMGTPVGSAGGWGTPTPPPPVATSGEYSSGFSGQYHNPMPLASPQMGGLGFTMGQFSYDELAVATGGFSQANLLGQGGFGYVHKGVLSDGRDVAVKSLKTGSGQGEREFQAEVEIISRVHHRHLVSLVGYCIADGQRMLVYEFVPNKTMEFHLHGKGQPVMDWATRLRIALGSAKGLAYLHEDCHPRIIHRDIKAANILLDNNFEAMVADFGLAKLSSDNYTHVSTRVMGTFGYLAPEYASSGKLSEKSDVFSFGVLLLELITGRRPVDPSNKFMEDSLVDWARPLLAKALEDGNHHDLKDPRLEDNFVAQEMARMVTCAAASIRHSARRRPKMSQIVRALDGDSSLEDLNEGVKPVQSSASNSNGNTSSYDTGAYNADMMKFRQMVMSSQDFASSQYGATSEYGLNPSSSGTDSGEMGHSGLPRQRL